MEGKPTSSGSSGESMSISAPFIPGSSPKPSSSSCPIPGRQSTPPGQGRARITGFSIVEVELEEGHRSAVVTIRRLVTAPAGSVRVKEKFRWKREDGEWFLDPADPPKTDSEIFTEYYYKKQGIAPTAEFEERVFDFGLAVQGEPVQPRFSFRNPSSRDIIVEKNPRSRPAHLTDRTEKRLIPAGAAGEITVELNTAKLHRDFIQDIFVQFEPVKEIVKLRITGRVFTAEEIAKSPSLSKEAAAREVRHTGEPLARISATIRQESIGGVDKARPIPLHTRLRENGRERALKGKLPAP